MLGTLAFAGDVAAAAGFMVIFEVKGIKAHGEEAHNNECQSFHFVKLKSRLF